MYRPNMLGLLEHRRIGLDWKTPPYNRITLNFILVHMQVKLLLLHLSLYKLHKVRRNLGLVPNYTTFINQCHFNVWCKTHRKNYYRQPTQIINGGAFVNTVPWTSCLSVCCWNRKQWMIRLYVLLHANREVCSEYLMYFSGLEVHTCAYPCRSIYTYIRI